MADAPTLPPRSSTAALSYDERTDLRSALYLLREHLEREKVMAARGRSVEHLCERMDYVIRAVDRIAKEQISQSMQLVRFSKKLAKATARTEDEPAEDTGSYRIEELKRQVAVDALLKETEKEKDYSRENSTFWQRQKSQWVFALVLLVVSAFTSGCFSVGFWYATRNARAAVPAATAK